MSPRTNRLRHALPALLTTLLASPAWSAEPEPDATPPASTEHRTVAGTAGDSAEEQSVTVGVDFAPMIGLSSSFPERRRMISLNVLGGLSGGIDAFEIGAGLNITTGTMSGLQLSGGANLVTAPLDGVQAAGAVNVLTSAFDGAQLGGGVNVAGDDSRGVQLAGEANLLIGGLRGAQIAPFNLATGPVEGLQLGVVNLAPSAEVGIGLLNVYWDGFADLEVFGSEEGLAMGGIRHGSGALYNVYFAGGMPNGNEWNPAYGLGIGGRWLLGPRLELSIDATATQVVEDGDFGRQNNLNKLRPLVAWRFNDDVALFGGPTWTVQIADPSISDDYAPLGAWTVTEDDADVRVMMWPGLTAGARFL